MDLKKLCNEVLVPFLMNVLAWIIGIAVTFAGQAKIDKKHDIAGIASGLNVVKKELATNIEDLRYANADMEAICYSANYLYSQVDNLSSCPADSIAFHWENLQVDYYLSLPKEALQMLESTYLFSDLLGHEMSLSIVRAYDICETLERSINSTTERRISSIENIDNFFLMQADNGRKMTGVTDRISSHQGRQVLQKLSGQRGGWIEPAIADIEETISRIDEYLAAH